MKWFKHMTDMLDDTFVIKLVDEFGIAGYGIWVGLLELYAKYSKDNCGEWVEISQSLYEYKLRSKRRTVTRLLVACQSAGKLEFRDKGYSLELRISKMASLKDEWSSRKVKNSGVSREKLPHKNKEELTNVNSEKEQEPKEPDGFRVFYAAYPKKTTKKETLDYWKRHKLDSKLTEILNGLNVWKNSGHWSAGNRFAPDPIRFLNKERWLDEPEKRLEDAASRPTGSQIPGNQISQHQWTERSGKL